MNFLKTFEDHDDKACGKWSHYLDIYEKHLSKFVGKEILLFEIGVCKGGSLQIWKKIFGDKCKIVGFDIDIYSVYSEDQITVENGDATNYQYMMSMIQKHGTPDIIIDDGSHIQTDVMTSFGFLFPVLNNNGIYIIEDTHTAYRKEYNGGLNSPFNINTLLSRAVHDPSLQFITENYTPTLPMVSGLCFYNSMTIVEKGDGKEVVPIFSGDEKYKNVQMTKPHTISQVTPDGVEEINQDSQSTQTKDTNDISDDPEITPESIKKVRSIQYPPQSEFDQIPSSDLSDDEESLFKWHV